MSEIKFKFKNCGCIYPADYIKSIRTKYLGRYKCPKHPLNVLECVILTCACGVEHEEGTIGKHSPDCKECRARNKAEYDKRYGAEYKKNGSKGVYKKPIAVQSLMDDIGYNTPVDLDPNPDWKDKTRPPCTQGPCQVHQYCIDNHIGKNNTACIHRCDYRLEYIGIIQGFYMPGIEITAFQRRQTNYWSAA